MKRGNTDLSFLLGVDKPVGISSHDLVNKIRGITQEKRVGHAGTLDPLASGVMLLAVGPATRLLHYLSADNKAYRARISFGTQTTTDDSEGEVLYNKAVPGEVLQAEYAKEILSQFLGMQKQVPPNFSAIHIDGKRAYDLARGGNAPEIKARTVEIYSAELLQICREDSIFWDVYFDVSKGTYIRSLARDIGKTVGSCAHLKSLRRCVSGKVSLEQCLRAETIKAAQIQLQNYALNPVELLEAQEYHLNESELEYIKNGSLPHIKKLDKVDWCFTYQSKLFAYQKNVNVDKAQTVYFPKGIEGVAACC